MVVPCVLIFQVVNREFQDQHCCAVCLDLLYEPFKCSCDHVFCDPCLRQLNFRTGSRGMIRCPLCRQIVQHIIPATGMLENLSFHYYTEVVVIIKPPTCYYDNWIILTDWSTDQPTYMYICIWSVWLSSWHLDYSVVLELRSEIRSTYDSRILR